METNQLTMRWVPVTDATGRTHLEAVWITEAGASVTSRAGSGAATAVEAAVHAA